MLEQVRRRGAHAYHGKRNDRFKRMFSKLGVPRKDLTKIFKQIDEENSAKKKIASKK